MRFPLLCFAASSGCGALASFYNPSAASTVACDNHSKAGFPTQFTPYTIGEIRDISHDTKVFRFLLEDPQKEYRLKVCGTLQCRIPYVTQQIQRMYTPVTTNGTKGYFEIIVKKMPHGKMTQFLWDRKVGENVQFRGVGYNMDIKPNRWKELGFIAGGVGFTPVLQVMHHLLHHPKDHTKMTFLFCNRTPSDILLKDYLDDLEAKNKGRLTMKYAIDKDEVGWTGLVGYPDANMIRSTMPAPGTNNKIMICGPDRMINALTGMSLDVMGKWSGVMAAQPSAPGAYNLGPLGGTFLSMGYIRDEVYVF